MKEKELEGKTEKEKADILQQQKEKELQEKTVELEVAQANFLKTKMIAEEKLDPSIIELVSGRTETEIKTSVKKFRELWNMAEKAGVEKALKGTNTTPGKSSGVPTGNIISLQTQLNEAKKSGNQMEALRLMREIEEERNKA